MLFSQRMKIAKQTENWCKENNVKQDFLGCISALEALNYFIVTTKEIEEFLRTIECSNACGHTEPYGWVPEDGCSIHDPDCYCFLITHNKLIHRTDCKFYLGGKYSG